MDGMKTTEREPTRNMLVAARGTYEHLRSLGVSRETALKAAHRTALRVAPKRRGNIVGPEEKS